MHSIHNQVTVSFFFLSPLKLVIYFLIFDANNISRPTDVNTDDILLLLYLQYSQKGGRGRGGADLKTIRI